MRTTIIVLFVISVAAYSVKALKCYTCAVTTSHADCIANTAVCSAGQDTCMSIVSSAEGQSAYAKACSTSQGCSAAATLNSQIVTTTCCTTDLCNSSSAFKMNFWLLGLCAVFIFFVSRS
ncbi:ly6/PLAUR domain-containing protein 2-like isoform X5 [Erpetoichthys calabaricus]|uniref:ly6/PLAUR domain-containing protein 2-like isoform X1 n=1 Tax=Erpetoichthys calabaricus TaxID=27687 RepID=UPI0022346E08|nr:ly6/PLAUR domain-containing protein 2-like isoform X1 [Erpetoichthys calabaricus]XP_051791887.1 ly6/PLAUR domain-containing protein 2-like isoform X5 [Erpetoichthys calabaricus]